MKSVTCPNCSNTFSHDIAVARAVGLGLGVMAGKQGAAQALIVGAVGYVAGHVVDAILVEYIDPICPDCGLAIRDAASIIARS